MRESTQTEMGGNGNAPEAVALGEWDELPLAVLELRNLRHEFVSGAAARRNYVVRVEELYLPWGEFIAILGPSGCGKTTLLTILGLARKPFRTGGQPAAERFTIRTSLETEPLDILALYNRPGGSRKIQGLRRELLGFCLQSGELLANLTLQENVEMPMRLNGWKTPAIRRRTQEVLENLSDTHPGDVGGAPPEDEGQVTKTLWDLRDVLPRRVSGGEYQRVALARAIAHGPRLLFLDEPTGSLDPITARSALTTLARMQKDEDVTVVMITHDPKLAKEFAGFIVCMCAECNGSQATPTGTIERFFRKSNEGKWIRTDARWQPLPDAGAEEPVEEEGRGGAVLAGE